MIKNFKKQKFCTGLGGSVAVAQIYFFGIVVVVGSGSIGFIDVLNVEGKVEFAVGSFLIITGNAFPTGISGSAVEGFVQFFQVCLGDVVA